MATLTRGDRKKNFKVRINDLVEEYDINVQHSDGTEGQINYNNALLSLNDDLTPKVIDKVVITGRTTVTAVGADYVLISDSSDNGNLKKALASDLAGAGGYTDEQAQDAIGAMIDSTLTYVDGTPLLQRSALTGDVTASAGSNATALDRTCITGQVNAVADGADYVLISDTSASGALKKALISTIGGGSGIQILTTDPVSPTDGQEWILETRSNAGTLMGMAGGLPLALPTAVTIAMTLKIKGAGNLFYLNLLKQ